MTFDKKKTLKLIDISVFPLSVFYTELIIKAFMSKTFFDKNLIYIFLFSVSIGAIGSLLCGISGKKKVNTTLKIVLLSLLGLITGIQFFCRRTFGNYFGIGIMKQNGTGVITDFMPTIIKIIYTGVPLIILLFLPLICYCVFGIKRLPSERSRLWDNISLSALLIVPYAVALCIVLNSHSGIVSDMEYYTSRIEINASADRFGLLTGMRLDLQDRLFGEFYDTLNFDSHENEDIIIIEQQTEPDESAETETKEETDIETEAETEPVPIEYGDNVMDIDFGALIENETNKTLLSMHNYFKEKEPTKKNEYTGMFYGKNLIFIVAESFCPDFVDSKLTPTLYKLLNNGFVFNNYYQPAWGVSTSDGEYSSLMGLVPESGINSMYRSRLNNNYFVLGNQFKRLGYTTNAYHNHNMDYYGRNETHPNLGYDFHAVGNGVENYTKNVWPRSDLEMMIGSVPEYIDKQPFHTYYMTVSGHGGYGRYGNSMSGKNIDKVENLPYSDVVKAYIAAQLEFEYALENLISQLDEAGILDNTVIAFTNDHYPYPLDEGFEGNETSYYDELAGHEIERNFELYKNTFVIWCSSMEKTVRVNKPCYSLDILPTLSNLFGLEYDSRLLCGQDILSDSPGLVIFRNYSWISEKGKYNAAKNTFTANAGVTVDSEYVTAMNETVRNKVLYSEYVLEKNYYNVLFGNK